MAEIVLLARAIVSVVVLAACCVAIVVMVRSKREISATYRPHHRCLLGAHFGHKQPFLRYEGAVNHSRFAVFLGGGNVRACNFVILSCGVLLVVSVVLSAVTAARLFLRRPVAVSSSALLEFAVVMPSSVFIFIAAIMQSIGLAMTCQELLDNWNYQDRQEISYYLWAGFPKPAHCSGAFVFSKTFLVHDIPVIDPSQRSAYYFFDDLEMVETALWVACVWSAYLILSVLSTYRWLRQSAAHKEQQYGRLGQSQAGFSLYTVKTI